MYLSVSRISHTFGPKTVLQNVSFNISPGDRVGLVGANGSGKTTLLRIIAGQLSPDAGSVSSRSDLRQSYLPQHALDMPPDTTVRDLIDNATGGLRQIELKLRELEQAMSDRTELTDQLFLEYEHCQAKFEDRGGYDIDYRIDTVLSGLDIDDIPRTQPINTLSGGENGRLQLAMLLLQSPDLLLLDEPTNHLDVEGAAWLSSFLSDFHGAILTVSHDRRFLNDTVTRILDLDELSHSVVEYSGNYDFYRKEKRRELDDWNERFVDQQREIKELKRLIRARAAARTEKIPAASDPDKSLYNARGARADATAARDIRWFRERLKRLEENPVPKPPDPIQFDSSFSNEKIRSSDVITLDGISKSFGSSKLLDYVSFVLDNHSRIAFVGPNGAGKSTLLKIIAGIIEPDGGIRTAAPGVRIGYLDQDATNLNEKVTLFEAYSDGLSGYEHHLVSDLLTHGRFLYNDLDILVGDLSLGQRRKLQIARCIANQVNVLVLDEPTNFLSLDVLEEFERAIVDFAGPVVAVSHDRWFLERFAGQIWTLEDGRIGQHFDDLEVALASQRQLNVDQGHRKRVETI